MWVRYQGSIVQWWLNRLSARWPWTAVKVLSGDLEQVPVGRGRHGYRLNVAYSYSVAGREYSGCYVSPVGEESDARDLLASLNELPPPVRYRPDRPEVSVIEPYRDAALALGRKG